MKNLNQLRDEVFSINKANGWHEEERTFGELIALVHSEVSEALEDFRNGKAVNEYWYEYKSHTGNFTSNTKTKSRALLDPYYVGKELILGKPCGIPSELADIVIRILDICGLYEWDIQNFYEATEVIFDNKPFGAYMANIHLYLSNTYNAGDDKPDYTFDVIENLSVAIKLIEHICSENEINLEEIIHEKLIYNRTRGYKHGGKVL